jgi:hypothetical protein
LFARFDLKQRCCVCNSPGISTASPPVDILGLDAGHSNGQARFPSGRRA